MSYNFYYISFIMHTFCHISKYPVSFWKNFPADKIKATIL